MNVKDANQEPPEGSTPKVPPILVLGVGNVLQKDDGVGIHAVRALVRTAPAGVLAVEIGTDAWSALPLLEEADKVIVLDAMAAGGSPGSVYVATLSEIRREAVRGSLHEVDLVNVIGMMRGPKPEVMVVGVEPDVVDFGMELEPAVAAAVPRMVDTVMRLVREWKGQEPAGLPMPTNSEMRPADSGLSDRKC